MPLLHWNRLLFALLALRGYANAVFLQPTNDEGLWLWNARCDHWGLPALGILHSALSPVYYWWGRLLFAMFSPSILLMRFGNVTLLLAGLLFLDRRSRGVSPWAYTAVLIAMLLDPYLFQWASWAILEPITLALTFTVLGCLQRPMALGALGAVVGIAIATKASLLWLAGAGILRLRSGKDRLAFGLGVLATVSLLLGSIFFWSDPGRFLFMWLVNANRHGLFRGLLSGAASDPRYIYYWVLLVPLFLALALRRDRPFQNTITVTALVGILFAASQSYFPPRYLCPIAYAALFAGVASLARNYSIHGSSLLRAACVAIVFSNVGYALYYTAGHQKWRGWFVQKRIARAIEAGETIAAPPHLAISFRYPIQPTSEGYHVDEFEQAGLPDLYIYKHTAAQRTLADRISLKWYWRHGYRPQNAGNYWLFERRPAVTFRETCTQ